MSAVEAASCNIDINKQQLTIYIHSVLIIVGLYTPISTMLGMVVLYTDCQNRKFQC